MVIGEPKRDFEKKLSDLKSARDKLLAFHKLLIDRERRELERHAGTVSAGQFLNLLMTDEGFAWLRTISKLVVRIDEAFELDDGIPPDLVETFESEIASMFDESDSNLDFKDEVSARMKVHPEADSIRTDIKRMYE